MSAKRTPRGPYAKTAGRRAAILEAARASFLELGYDQSTLPDIARRAEMTLPGLMYHFRDKAELIAEILERKDAEGLERARALRESGVSSAEVLADVLREELSDPNSVRFWAELAPAASRSGHPARQYFAERYAQQRSLIAAGLADIGAADAEDAHDLACLLLAVAEGLQVQWLFDPDVEVPRLIARFMELTSGDRVPGAPRPAHDRGPHEQGR